MGTIASQITSLTIVYSIVYSDADQRKHQSSASLAFAQGIHRGPVNSPHKWPVTRKMFPFDDVIMQKSGIDWAMIVVYGYWWYYPVIEHKRWLKLDMKLTSVAAWTKYHSPFDLLKHSNRTDVMLMECSSVATSKVVKWQLPVHRMAREFVRSRYFPFCIIFKCACTTNYTT